MKRSWDLATLAAMAVVVYATAIVAHEGGHAVAGWLVGGHPDALDVDGLLGFGDWMTILSRFDAEIALRVMVSLFGVAVTVLWVRAMAAALIGAVFVVVVGRGIPLG